jgi:hypothetical protein
LLIFYYYSLFTVLTNVIVCEDQSAYIRCTSPSRIRVSQAIYGRTADEAANLRRIDNKMFKRKKRERKFPMSYVVIFFVFSEFS